MEHSDQKMPMATKVLRGRELKAKLEASTLDFSGAERLE